MEWRGSRTVELSGAPHGHHEPRRACVSTVSSDDVLFYESQRADRVYGLPEGEGIMNTFEVTITRTERMTVKADTSDEALDIAFEATWTRETPDTNPCITYHESTTEDYTVEETEEED